MIYYLNLGFVLEQALVDVMNRYIARQNLDAVYQNFHIAITNEHPFAHMIVEGHERMSDYFPSVVVTTQSDSRPTDFNNMPVQGLGIGMTSDDIDGLLASFTRDKTKIENGETVKVMRKGQPVKERLPGVVLIYDQESINTLKSVADSRTKGDIKGMVYGIKVDTRRRDHVSVEIWCDNNQLKNELYEHLRLFAESSLEKTLDEYYAAFHPSLIGNTIHGERSSNYNFDFDVMLSGSHITFDVDYDVAQLILDTEITEINYEIITEVFNHVKEF